MVKLTNPQGESKILSDKEYDDLLWKFIGSNKFQKWSYNNNLIGSYKNTMGKRSLTIWLCRFS